MIEELLITARANPKVDPVLDIWTWEIANYLFLGGLAAGIMILVAVVHLSNKQEAAPAAAWRLPLWAFIALSVGMTTLFMDLEYKLHVFRFYTTLQTTSPMSWGSWILLLVYPLIVLLIASTLRRGYPRLAGLVERLPGVELVLDMTERYRKAIAFASLPVAVALGIYTGILLSGFSARPFWNTSILGPLFLISGLSTAAALAILVASDKAERHLFARVDLIVILVEIVLVGVLLIGLATGAAVQNDALALILGGPFTLHFWIGFFALGLLLPFLLESAELGGLFRFALIAPVLVLVGGFMLRQVALDVGQASGWQDYAVSSNPALLELVRHAYEE